MKIEIEQVPEMTIEEFADAHDLTMKVIERDAASTDYTGFRYIAHFVRCDVGGDGMLRGVFGNGHTPEGAIRSYVPQISEKMLVFNGNREDERRIKAPRLTVSSIKA